MSPPRILVGAFSCRSSIRTCTQSGEDPRCRRCLIAPYSACPLSRSAARALPRVPPADAQYLWAQQKARRASHGACDGAIVPHAGTAKRDQPSAPAWKRRPKVRGGRSACADVWRIHRRFWAGGLADGEDPTRRTELETTAMAAKPQPKRERRSLKAAHRPRVTARRSECRLWPICDVARCPPYWE
jgi:hypothetical protein